MLQFRGVEFKFENKETVPVVETVRVALFYHGKFLLLEKDATSRNAGALEFPGGKIDDIKDKTSTLEEQKQAAVTEMQQETGIEIEKFPLEKVDSFEIFYQAIEPDGHKKKYRRLIHLFLIRLPDSENVVLKINQTKDEKGESEDRHKDFKWVSPGELANFATSLSENSYTKKKIHLLSKNSRRISQLLKAVEYSKSL